MINKTLSINRAVIKIIKQENTLELFVFTLSIEVEHYDHFESVKDEHPHRLYQKSTSVTNDPKVMEQKKKASITSKQSENKELM